MMRTPCNRMPRHLIGSGESFCAFLKTNVAVLLALQAPDAEPSGEEVRPGVELEAAASDLREAAMPRESRAVAPSFPAADVPAARLREAGAKRAVDVVVLPSEHGLAAGSAPGHRAVAHSLVHAHSAAAEHSAPV